MLRLAALMAFIAAASPSLLARLSPEAGEFLIQKFSAKDYSASPQNWAVVQDSRGIVYAANTAGILEFDGVSWRRIPISVRSGVRALAIDSRGTVFAGGQGIFGYLAPDLHGALQFVSLVDKIPPTERSFGDVWDVLPTSDGVYFSSYRRLFLYTPDGRVRVFSPTERFGRAFTYHEELFITSSDRGLLTIHGKDLVRSFDADPKVVRSNPIFAPGSMPLLAVAGRLYRFSPGAINLFPTAADQYFHQHGVNSLLELASGDIAVGTISGGMVLLNSEGELQRIVHAADGLPSDRINSIYPDRQNGFWVSTDNGLARFVTSLTNFGQAQGLRGNVYAIGRLGGVLYAGTSIGLFRMRTVPGGAPVFDPVPEVQDTIFDILDHPGMPLVGGTRGLFLLDHGKFRSIFDQFVYDFSFSQRSPDIIYTAGRDGVHMLRRAGGKWSIASKETGDGHEFRTVLEAPDGTVWATQSGSISRINFSTEPPTSQQFNASSGVPAGWANAYSFRNHIVFATERNGLLKYSEPDKRFVPDLELGPQFSNGRSGVSVVREDSRNNVWVTGDGYHGILHNQAWFPRPLLQSGIDEIYAIYLDPDGVCWASGASGLLFRYSQPSARKQELNILLRSAVVTNQELSLFGGDGSLSKELRLPFRDNALRFEFAAPFFEDQASVEYQFRLAGSEANWSAWTTESRKDYTNLPAGNYNFQVRARNPHEVVTGEAVFPFSMLPPWYLTWWAYAAYAAVFLYAGWLILQWRLRALRARNKWLERVVEERTAEVRTERDQNEALLLNILPSPIASELRTTGSVKPTAFEDVTVCFSDFVGFTLSSEKLPAQELISSLNNYFTAFDEIIGRYGLEKLKTIGDAYMFAGGLPNASPSHAVDAVLAALEMVEVARKLACSEKGINWSIRLGLYSGPVVAGVVGVRKFAFDIWGNTVNFAARMEAAGLANRVNLSATTGSRVFDFIDCEPRGRIRIKEGREMEMYFALRPKPELLAGPLVDGIPEAFRLKYEQTFSQPPKSFPNLNGSHAS